MVVIHLPINVLAVIGVDAGRSHLFQLEQRHFLEDCAERLFLHHILLGILPAIVVAFDELIGNHKGPTIAFHEGLADFVLRVFVEITRHGQHSLENFFIHFSLAFSLDDVLIGYLHVDGRMASHPWMGLDVGNRDPPAGINLQHASDQIFGHLAECWWDHILPP